VGFKFTKNHSLKALKVLH